MVHSLFETIADEIDATDNDRAGDNGKTEQHYKKLGRPYLRAVGMEDGVSYILTMSPLMCDILTSADFMQADVTYDENTEYHYLLNVVAFNFSTMEWMTVARVRLSCETSDAYRIAFQKVINICRARHPDFSPTDDIKGIVIDWSRAEMNGLKLAVGETAAMQLLRGCQVHWIRSCQRICERVSTSKDKRKEMSIFKKLASAITSLNDCAQIIACFEALCGERTVSTIYSEANPISFYQHNRCCLD